MKIKRFEGILLCAALLAASGCAAKKETGKEIYDKVYANFSSADSYKASLDCPIKFEASQGTEEMPMTMDLELANIKEKAENADSHITLNMTVSGYSASVEMWGKDGMLYTDAAGTKSTSAMDTTYSDKTSLLDKDDIESATVTKDGDNYVLDCTLSDDANQKVLQNVIGSLDDSGIDSSTVDVTINSFQLTAGKDYYPVSESIDFSAKMSLSGTDYTISAVESLTFSDFNNTTIDFPDLSAWGTASSSSSSSTASSSENGDWDAYASSGFQKVTDTMGLAYFTDINGDSRDCYIPYGGSLYPSDHGIQGSNHGVAITVTMVKADSASASLQDFVSQVKNLNYDNAEFQDIQTADNDTVGYCRMNYTYASNGTEYQFYSILYTDVRDSNLYLQAWIDFVPQLYDSQTQELLNDIEEYYAVSLPSDVLIK